MEDLRIYEDIALRTDGDIYLGIVGPVRTGKSTFIKRFMDTMVIPNIENAYMRERAKDELPQSGSGKTIMTAEPKFVPEEAVNVRFDGGSALSVRLIDCVGYMVDGAVGQFEDGMERMVTTPWFDHAIPMAEAAELGTRKVIQEHSTIGIVVTTDGSFTEFGRSAYEPAERRVIEELKSIGKPFMVLVNSADAESAAAKRLAEELSEKYKVACLAKNCLELSAADVEDILKALLYEFPVAELGVFLPPWIDALPMEHPLKMSLFGVIRESASGMVRIMDVSGAASLMSGAQAVESAAVTDIDLGSGVASITIALPKGLFYETLSEESGFEIRDDGDLMGLLAGLSAVKERYDKISAALDEVRETGYGIVLPSRDELRLEEPEIVRQGGRYGVRLKASAPSIHMIMANVETEVSPVVGGERQSEDIISYLLQEFEGDTGKIWQSNIFGKPLYDIASEGLNAKIKRMPDDARSKLRETLQRIINEGSGGLICIIL